MVDLSEFRAPPRTSTKCLFARVADKLDEDNTEKLQAALADSTISNYAIRAWLVNKTGTSLHSESVRRHRNQTCGCYA